MRRFKQQIPDPEAHDILAVATSGVLSLTDGNGAPYGVPMSFVCDGGRSIYFHCAREGRRMECLRHDSRASFCVVAADDVVPGEFTTYYRSVIAEGRISVVTERDAMIAALRLLCAKYSPGIECGDEIAKSIDHVAVLRLDIESLSGKEAVELTRRR